MLPTAVLTDLWPLMMDIRQQVFPARRSYFKAPPPIDIIQQEFDIRGETLGHFLYCMSNYNPDQFSVAHYRQRNCYDSLPTVEGWIRQWVAEGLLETAVPTIYLISEKGRRLFDRANELIRDTAEELTDEYFYHPWSCLSNREIELLRDLLTRLYSSLKTLAQPL